MLDKYANQFKNSIKSDMDISEEEYQEWKMRIRNSCDISHICNLKEIEECCSIFREQFRQIEESMYRKRLDFSNHE